VPSHLNPRYTFPAFIVGKSNEAAYTTASAAAVAPGRVYTPILISGATARIHELLPTRNSIPTAPSQR
jgi:chromosomal replication initiation ATPase DnaA